MFKWVVLSAVLVSTSADPGGLLTPFSYSSTVVSPGITTVSKQASCVVHTSPYLSLAAPYFAHLIKKRSAVFTPFFPSHYVAPVLPTPFLRTPLAPIAVPIYHTPLHFIKKRSAVLTTPYIAPLPYSSPYPYFYSPRIIPAAPVYTRGPIAYPHYIKKRSAPVLSSLYAAYKPYPFLPATYSAQLYHASPVISYNAYPYAPPHVIKKRTVQLLTSALRWFFGGNGGNQRRNGW